MYFTSLNIYLGSLKDVAPFKILRLLRTIKALKNIAPKKVPPVYVFVLLFVLTACDNDDSNDDSALVKSGILGRWELLSRSFDGITPLIREVGYYLTLEEDQSLSDFSGDFSAISPGSESSGTFELDPVNGTVSFELGLQTLIYEYDLQDDALIFDYQEDGTAINEIWIRTD
jgi:hypothetical protein